MKKLKDFLYDKNDIIIALCILVVAGLLIIWRIDAIMQYPQTLAQETHTVETTDDKAVDDSDKDDSDKSSKKDKDKKDNDKSDKKDSETTQSSGVWSGETLAKDVTVTVAGGSAAGAVQSLIDAGLFESYDDYVSVCNYYGLVPENIKATTFTFAAGSTKADIAVKVTE